MQEFKLRPFLVSQLMRPVSTGRIVHAQIFYGDEGTGKSEAAKYIAQAMNCTSFANKPCGVCPSCLRYMDNNAPELIQIYPNDRHIINVDSVRELIKKVAIKPDARLMPIIIHEADRMNESAQNALLKTLEEAPDYAAFFLLTERLSALLPTIRSRCVLMRFAPLGYDEVREGLIEQGISYDKAREFAALSGGSIGKALKISKDPKFAEALSKLSNICAKLKSADDVPLVAGELAYFKDETRLLLDLLECCAGELMRKSYVTAPAVALSKNGIDGLKLLKAIIKCRQRLDSHVNYQYAAENLLFEMFDKSNL